MLYNLLSTNPEKLAKENEQLLEESNLVSLEANTVNGKALDNKVDSN